MARNMYGATSADFTITSGGRVIPGAVLTLWTARTGGTQITDLLDVDSVACTTVTSAADGSVVYYGPNNDKTVHWADSGQGSRVAIRPTDITGDPPVMSIGTVGTGTAAASLTGTSEAPVLNLTLPSSGANGVNTAAIQDGAVTPAKLATTGRFTFPTGEADGYGFVSGASHLSGTGAPEGVVTAAPGSTWLQTDSTTDVKGWIRWVKATGTGNTGWIAGAEADTGWRDVAAGLINGWATDSGAPRMEIRRVGSLVWVRATLDASSASDLPLYNLPSGFTFSVGSGYTYQPVPAHDGSTGESVAIEVHSIGYIRSAVAVTAALVRMGGSWPTPDAWPASLPGSAA